MVVHGEGYHAQEEAGHQEKPDASPDGSADAIVEHPVQFLKHAAFYGIYAIMSRIDYIHPDFRGSAAGRPV